MRYWTRRKIPGDPQITMVVASYLNEDPRRRDSLMCLLYSFKAQSYTNWTAIVVHDGPLVGQSELFMGADSRIQFVQTEKRLGKFGHPHRRKYACAAPGEFVAFTNDDCYYAPVYFEWMLAELTAKKADLAYCDMVHSHQGWRGFKTGPRRGQVDMGCFVARKSLVKAVPMTDYSFRGDGIFFEDLAKRSRRTVKIPAMLYVHN